METIVVGVDGSEGSAAALRWALREARMRGAKIRVVHAWAYPEVSTYHEAAHALRIPFAEEASRLVDRIVEEASSDAEGLEIEKVVVEGEGAPSLVEAAHDASMLVVGSRGLGGFAGLLLGSVSQQCAHHATCPLVIIPQDRPR